MTKRSYNDVIYYSNNKKITQKVIENTLLKSGIKRGDIIMVHSDLSAFGKLGEIKDKNRFLQSIFNAFINVIGKEGTLIVPTYNTDSFCKNKIFDVKNTMSTVGIFTEFVRNKKEAIRSEDPIHSHAGIGKNAEKLLKNVSNQSFGKDSFFDRLYKMDGKIINFGKFFDITFLHYIENNFKVDYRFDKKFSGTIIKEDGSEEYKEVIYYVRYLPEEGKDVKYDMTKLGDELERRGLLKRVRLGENYILCSRARDCYNVGIEMLKKNEYAFLIKDSNILELKALPFFTGVLDLPEDAEFPLKFPFVLKYDKNSNLIIQEYSREVEKNLRLAYKKGSLLSTSLGEGSFGVRRADDMLKYLLTIFKKPISKTSFLEIGCGDGYLLYRLKLLGAESLIGCEPGPVALEGNKKFGVNVVNEFYKPNLFNKKFDIIFSYCLLEHINNPPYFIELQKKSLKKEGIIFIAVPNFYKKLQLGDISLLTHEHWNYFTPESIKNLLIKHNFKDVDTALGMNEAVIYAWGIKSKQPNQKLGSRSDEELFNNFCHKVRKSLSLLQEEIDKLEREGKTLGLYGGGLNIISLLDHKLKPRFFNGDVAQQGKHYPGYKNSIENPQNLLLDKVDEIWVIPIDYDEEIINYLKKELAIPAEINTFSFKKFLKGL